MEPGNQAKIYEQLSEHSVAIGQLNTAVTQIQNAQRQILDALRDMSDKTKPDYKWIWGALGVLVMIASGYTTLITTPMSARISRLEDRSEKQTEHDADDQRKALHSFAELSYRLGRLEILHENRPIKQGD